MSREHQQVLDYLRAHVGDGDFKAALQSIVHAAQMLTGANGAAIAMQCEGVVLCQARAGEMAPPLGAKLDVGSGISGECLRTACAAQCEDTSKDARVDPDLCRQLGLSSLAAVPLGKEPDVIGILEVFSALPYSFSLRHFELLQDLAGLVIAAQDGQAAVIGEEGSKKGSRAGREPGRVRHRPDIPRINLLGRIRNRLQKEGETLAYSWATRAGRRNLLLSGISAMVISLAWGWILGYREPAKTPPLRNKATLAKRLKATSSTTASTLMVRNSGITSAGDTQLVKPNPSSVMVMTGKRERLDTAGSGPEVKVQPENDSTHLAGPDAGAASAPPENDSTAQTAPALSKVRSGGVWGSLLLWVLVSSQIEIPLWKALWVCLAIINIGAYWFLSRSNISPKSGLQRVSSVLVSLIYVQIAAVIFIAIEAAAKK